MRARRYYFVLQWPHKEHDDEEGTLLRQLPFRAQCGGSIPYASECSFSPYFRPTGDYQNGRVACPASQDPPFVAPLIRPLECDTFPLPISGTRDASPSLLS